MASPYQRKPDWLRVPGPSGDNFHEVRRLVENNHLHTVCKSAHCPNIGECWGRRTATFLILGNICTRNCRFCAVSHGAPLPLDADEPQRVAEAIATLNLKYAVITSVTRDDLPDGGAGHFAETIRAVHQRVPRCQVEVLIPDFLGKASALRNVVQAGPAILNHNVETVPRLYSTVRPQAEYQRSLTLLEHAKKMGATTKSGIMVGIGESMDEVLEVLRDLRQVECDLLTIGQYMAPSRYHVPIHRFVAPAEFVELKEKGLKMGFQAVESAPLVRSSYHADQAANSIHADTDSE